MQKLYAVIIATLFLANNSAFAQWQLTPDAHAGYSYCMDARPSGKIFIGGYDTLITSNNFGQAWNVAGINPHITITNPLCDITDIAFLNDFVGFACVNVQVAEEAIIKTTDGGNTWASVMDSLPGTLVTLTAIQFPTDSVGFCVGRGKIYKSGDAGNNWSLVYYNQNFNFTDVYFANHDTGYAVTAQGYVYTVNGGLTWITHATGISPQISAIQFPTDTIGYAIGEYSSLLYKFSGNGLDTIYSNLASVLLDTFNNHDLFFTSHDTGYVISDNNIFQTTDGGLSWAFQHFSNRPGFRHIKFVSNSEGAILCANGRVYTTTNQGGVYKPLSKIIAGWNGTYCQGSQYTFTAAGNPFWNYKWYLNGILVSTAQSFNVHLNNANYNTLSSVVSNGVASDTNSLGVFVNMRPVVDYFQVMRSPTDTICPYTSGNVDVWVSPVQSGATYTLLHNGAYVTNVLPDSRYYANPAGVYTVIASDSNICGGPVKDTVSINIPVHPAPSPNPNLSAQIYYLQDTICMGDSITLVFQNTSPLYTYSFYAGGSYSLRGNGGTLSVRQWSRDVLHTGQPTYIPLYINITSGFNCNYNVIKNDTVVIDTAIASFSSVFADYLTTDTVYLNNISTGGLVQWSCNPLSAFSNSLAWSPYLTTAALNGPDNVSLIVQKGICRDTASQTIYFHQQAPALNLPACYKTAMHTPGTDNNQRAILDQHVNRAGELLVAGYYAYAMCGNLCTNWSLFIAKFDTSGHLAWERKCLPYSGGDSAVYTGENTMYYDFSAVTGITTDDNDNIYVSGVFTSDHFNLDTVKITTPTPNTQTRTGFIAKLNPQGRCIWMIATLSLPDNGSFGYERNTYFSDIEYWGNGVLLAAGRDTATAAFKNGVFGFNGPVVLDTNGRFIKSYPLYDLAPNNTSSLYVDNNRPASGYVFSLDESLPYFPLIQKQGNDMYLYGFFRGLGDSVQQINSTVSAGNNVGIFASKLSYSGWQWLKELGSGIYNEHKAPGYNSFALDDSDNMYLVQDYLVMQTGNLAYFNPGHYHTIISPAAFVSKFSPAGNLLWTKNIPSFPRSSAGSSQSYLANELQIVFASRHLYLNFKYEGNFAGIESNGSTLSFDNLDYPNPPGRNPMSYDAVLELDVAGNLTGAAQLGRAILGYDIFHTQICTNPCHTDVYVTGYWLNDSVYQGIPSYPQPDSIFYYAMRLSPTNGCMVSTCNSAPFAPPATIASCTDSVIINYNNYISDIDGDSVFISNVHAPSGTVQIVSGSIKYRANNTGIISDTIFYTACDAQNACDSSMFFINLTIANIISSNDTLRSTSSLSGYQYAWIDCNTDMVVSRDSVFVPALSGIYALVKTLSCTDTSRCLAVIATKINGADAPSVVIWPNPVMKQLNISSAGTVDRMDIKIFDLEGRPVYEMQSAKESVIIDVQGWQAGCYFLQIASNSKTTMLKIIKMN